jgi:hypothetical protein
MNSSVFSPITEVVKVCPTMSSARTWVAVHVKLHPARMCPWDSQLASCAWRWMSFLLT